MQELRFLLVMLCIIVMSACSTSPPKNPENLCDIFEEKNDWFDDAEKAEKRWGSPIPIMMSFIYQESSYRHDARPPKRKVLGFIPWGRMSSSYGYSQAKEDTWRWYQEKTGRHGADRDDFGDAIDFVGWYNNMSEVHNRTEPGDAYHLYLAYHEGHGGFNRRSFKNKPWLKRVAKKVSARSSRYSKQLASCRESLEPRGWFW